MSAIGSFILVVLSIGIFALVAQIMSGTPLRCMRLGRRQGHSLPPVGRSKTDAVRFNRPTFRTFLDIVAIALSLIGLVLWIPSFLPNIQIRHYNSSDVLSSKLIPFSVTNNGLGAVYDVRAMCFIRDLTTNRNNTVGPIGIVDSVSRAFELPRSDTFDFSCPAAKVFHFSPDERIVSALVDIVISYVPVAIPLARHKCVLFDANVDESNQLQWLQRPELDNETCNMLARNLQ
jgi:hypothetical protein